MKQFPNSERPDREWSAEETRSRLLADRIIFIGTPIDDQVANLAIAQMLFLESEDPIRDITLYVNSPGGAITASMALYDTMGSIGPDVATVCFRFAAGTAALLVARGARGKRFALPTATFKFVRTKGSGRDGHTQGQLAELERMDRLCVDAFKSCLRRPGEEIRKAFANEVTLTAQEAIDFGMIDAIVRGGPSG